jgi:uncharacterized protein (DUF433 family)
MPDMAYTPQEATVIAGVKLAAVQKAITARRIPARTDRRTHRRRLDQTAIQALALVRSLPKELRLAPAEAYRLLKQAAPSGETSLKLGDVVRIDARSVLAEVARRVALYEKAREQIVCDDAIMGGTPTIRGTRITPYMILGRLRDGDGVETILEDYPYLDAEMIEAGALYAEANPLRGRPSGKPWRHVS